METINKPSRKQLRDALKEQSINQILHIPKSQLTAKERAFAEQVALGEPATVAYRKAYNTKAKPDNVKVSAHRVKSKPHVSLTIQAIQQANEAMKYQNAESLRSLAITSLVNVLTDPETKPQAKIQASKIIGQMTDVSLFTHRSETKVIHSSDDIKAKILQEIRGLMSNDIEDVIEKDATSLLAELTMGSENSEDDEPTGSPAPTFSDDGPHAKLHTIPNQGPQTFQDLESSTVHVDSNPDELDPPPVDMDTPR